MSLTGLRSRLFGGDSMSPNPVWVRVSAEEWMEVSVLPSDPISSLKDRIEAACPNSGCSDVSFSPPALRTMSNLVFLSARPHAYKDYAEHHSYKKFSRLYKMGAMHCMPTLLAGRMGSSAGAAFRGAVMKYGKVLAVVLPILFLGTLRLRSLLHPVPIFLFSLFAAVMYGEASIRKLHLSSEVWKDVAEDKVTNFLQYRRLYQEYSTVFFGDNGQGDLVCGEKLSRKTKECVSAVFIHEVLPREKQLTSLGTALDEATRCKEWENLNVYFHRTYIGAALNAYKCGLISLEGLSRVGRAAVEDLLRMRISCILNTKRDWNAVIDDLNADVERTNQLFQAEEHPHLQITPVPASAGSVSPVEMLRSETFAEFSFLTSAPMFPQ